MEFAVVKALVQATSKNGLDVGGVVPIVTYTGFISVQDPTVFFIKYNPLVVTAEGLAKGEVAFGFVQ